jgi:hypothetical protein
MHDRSTTAETPRSRAGTRVVWVVWRQQRFQVSVSLALIFTVALGLVFLRLNVVGALQDAGASPCEQTGTACLNPAFDVISDRYGRIASVVPLIMLALPPLLGALAGGPLFAREYEQGTQILALTKSVGPLRWWATKTVVAGVPPALALLALGLVNTWAMQPMAAFVARSMITPGFETRGITPTAYFILAFAVAVTAGILLRNTAAAIGTSIAVYVACLLVLGFFRPNYLTPVDFVDPLPNVAGVGAQAPGNAAAAWEIDNFFMNAAGDPVTVRFDECGDPSSYQQCALDQGVTAEVIRYQPADRYWAIQGIEGGLAVATGAAVLALGLVRLRRRVT